MSNVIQFGDRKKAEPKLEAHGPMYLDMDQEVNVSLNKALLTVQYCAYVLKDVPLAQDLLRTVAECPIGLQRITLPGRFHEVVVNTDTEATYRAILGVTD